VASKDQFSGAPVGVVLAGGASRRMGASKSCATLAGRPLLHWPGDVLRSVLTRVAVVAKADTELPTLPAGVELWLEPELPRHPLTGILEALARADGAAIVVCAVDLPFVDRAIVERLIAAPSPAGGIVVTAVQGRLQPLLARYESRAGDGLRGSPPDGALTETVRALGPAILQVPERTLVNVNRPEDLVDAERLLTGRDRSCGPAATSRR
jgi:molybdopterin-guanine dinucleotide biosynthesis protein A